MTSDTGTSRRQILKDTTHYLLSTMLAQTVGLLQSILLPVLFGPAQLGVWNLMNVIIGYSANAHLGILHGLNKKIPALRSIGRAREIDDLKDSVFWFNLLLGVIAGCVMMFSSFWASPVYASFLRIISLIIVLQMVFVFLFSMIRAESRFALVSRGIAVLSLSSTLFVILLAYLFRDRVLGALVGLTFAYMIVVIYWLTKSGYHFAFSIKWHHIAEAFVTGLPLIIIGLIDMILLSFDRWVIAWQLPAAALGFYALGIMASNLLGIVPTAAANVLYPRMLERFAAAEDRREVSGLLLNPIRAMAVVMIFLICAAAIILPVIIRLLLPKYLPSIPLIEILVPGAFFLAMAPIAGSFVITVNRQRALIFIQLIAMIIGFAIDILLLKAGYGILGIAYGTIVCYAIYGLGYVSIAVYLALESRRESLYFSAQLFALFLGAIVALKAASLYPAGDVSGASHIVSAVVRLAAVSCLLAPLIWLVNRKSGMLSMVWTEFNIWRATRSTRE